jgi:anti-anti-sigma factor
MTTLRDQVDQHHGPDLLRAGDDQAESLLSTLLHVRSLGLGVQSLGLATGQGLVLQVVGEADLGTRGVLCAALSGAIEQTPTPAFLVIDLSGLQFCDSRCVSSLIETHEEAKRLGIGFALAGVHTQLAWLWKYLEPRGKPAHYETVSEAVAELARASAEAANV